ncbi:hypothetical protein DYH10_03570 [Candidatus Saccharibacteria bacterium CPR2]|nr:hypothetical protein [Candidatus Saccharibacteria bacterium CPR2]
MEAHSPAPEEVGIDSDCELYSGEFDDIPEYRKIVFMKHEKIRQDGSKLMYIESGFSGEGSEARVSQPFEIDICEEGERKFMVGRLLLGYDQSIKQRFMYAEELCKADRMENVRRTVLANLDLGVVGFYAAKLDRYGVKAQVPGWVLDKKRIQSIEGKRMSQKQMDIFCQIWNKEAQLLEPKINNQ